MALQRAIDDQSLVSFISHLRFLAAIPLLMAPPPTKGIIIIDTPRTICYIPFSLDSVIAQYLIVAQDVKK